MITKKMQKYIDSQPPLPEKTVKHCVYINRIQKRITRELDMLFWLCKHHPEIFLDEETEYKETSGKIMSHRRLKRLLLCLKFLNPNADVELVLRNLDFPDDDTT